MAYYVDTSAFVKLAVREQRSQAFRAWAERNNDPLVSSDLLRTEALRAGRRHSLAALAAVRSALDVLTLLSVTREICERAAELDPLILRSLDALHVASAMALGDDLQAVVTYDGRMAEAANHCGIAVIAP